MKDNRKSVFASALDKSFMDTLAEVVLDLGSATGEQYDRRTLVEAGVANFKAARTLSRALRRLDIRSVTQLYTVGPRALLRVEGLGNAAMWVAMHVLNTAPASRRCTRPGRSRVAASAPRDATR